MLDALNDGVAFQEGILRMPASCHSDTSNADRYDTVFPAVSPCSAGPNSGPHNPAQKLDLTFFALTEL